MEIIPLKTFILGILAMEGRPLRLADIYRKIGNRKVSKPTVYRQLQNLITKGIVSQKDEEYILVQGGRLPIMATDFARISELEPILYDAEKGLRLTVYISADATLDLDRDAIKSDFKKMIEKYLIDKDSRLGGVFTKKLLNEEVLKKLIGVKFVLVASFDGTDFTTLTSKETGELARKRREVLDLLAETSGVTINELSDKLNLNILQVRQVVDPILASGFAKMDEGGKIRLTVEVRSNA